jgi:hypothetical protein
VEKSRAYRRFFPGKWRTVLPVAGASGSLYILGAA